MMWAASVLLTVTSGFIEVSSLELPGPAAHCFLVDLQGDELADLGILHERTLYFYEQVQSKAPLMLELPEKVSAVDVSDLDSDGWCEVIAVAEDRIMQVSLLSQPPFVWQELFTCDSEFTAIGTEPYLHVLVLSHQDTLVIALPMEDRIELRTLDGEVMESYSFGSEAATQVTYGRPFVAWTTFPPELGSAGAIEYKISRVSASKPNLPDELKLDDSSVIAAAPITFERAQQASTRPVESWPEMALLKPGQGRSRSLIAVSGGIQPVTLVSTIMEPEPGGPADPSPPPAPGPIRRYPGVPLFAADLPDFNGDGFNDLVLWRSRDLQPSLNRVTRAALSGTWPLRLTIHLFSAERERFTPRAESEFDTAIPTAWLLSALNGVPLRHIVINDLNGDGRSDLGFSNGPASYSVWLSNSEDGFSRRPSFTHEFPEEIVEVTFVQDLDGDGRASIGLGGLERIYVLNPKRASITGENFAPVERTRPADAPPLPNP